MKKILFLTLLPIFIVIFSLVPKAAHATDPMGGLNIHVQNTAGTALGGASVRVATQSGGAYWYGPWWVGCPGFAFVNDGPGIGDAVGSGSLAGSTNGAGNWGFPGYTSSGPWSVWGLSCNCNNFTVTVSRAGYFPQTHTEGFGNGWNARTYTLTPVPPPPPPIPTPSCSVNVNPTTVQVGSNVNVSWNSANATSARIFQQNISTGQPYNQWNIPVNGSQAVNMNQLINTKFWVMVWGPGGSNTCGSPQVTVTAPPPACQLSQSPNPVTSGQNVTINWAAQNATSGTLHWGSGMWSTPGLPFPNGSGVWVNTWAPVTYTLNVSGAGGSSSCSLTTNIVKPPPSVGLNLTARPMSVLEGNPTTVTYTPSDADWCWAWTSPVTNPAQSPWNGWMNSAKGPHNVIDTPPFPARTYMMKCGNTASKTEVTKAVTVMVTSPIGLTLDATPKVLGPSGPSTTTVTHTPSGNATWCWAWASPARSNWAGWKPSANGTYNKPDSPTSTTTYFMSCGNGRSQVTKSVTVQWVVPPAPLICSLSVTPPSIKVGQFVNVSWSFTKGGAPASSLVQNIKLRQTVTASGAVELTPLDGLVSPLTLFPMSTTTYSLSAEEKANPANIISCPGAPINIEVKPNTGDDTTPGT